ncbi:MAG TPA: HEAT repeat domain-containing protein, partial [Pyrinomonadaceae bacterium]|nr:HEAT repeat domain-containing protein [Pyrinomonadaceae bacterium]
MRIRIFSCALIAFLGFATGTHSPRKASAQGTSSQALTPLQREIERESQRFASSSVEERRDALMRLGAMHRPDASRAAAAALHDPAAIVRATATHAVVWLAPDEAAALILPLLKDRDEFVRREAAYSLGETRSPLAVQDLITLLANDKKFSVRASAAVSLGLIGDERAVVPLAQALGKGAESSGLLNKLRGKRSGENEFVRRAAAVSLGQIHSR